MKLLENHFLENVLGLGERPAFLHEYWEKKAGVFTSPSPELIQQLYTLEDLEARIRFSPVPENACRLYKDGEVVPRSHYADKFGRVDFDRVMDCIAHGASINPDSLHRYSNRLLWFIRNLEQTLCCPINVNLYYTPPQARAADPHYDYHSILATQTRGAKTWQLAEGLTRECPVRELHNNREAGPPLGEPIVVRAGQMLYLPRGLSHMAWCEAEDSIHLTVGFHPVTWYRLLSETLKRVGLERSSFRRALRERRAEHLAESLHYLRDELDSELLLEELRSLNQTSFLAPAEGCEKLRPPDGVVIEPATRLRCASPLKWKNNGLWLSLQRPPGELKLRAETQPILQAIPSQAVFEPQSLPHPRARLFCHYLYINDLLELAP